VSVSKGQGFVNPRIHKHTHIPHRSSRYSSTRSCTLLLVLFSSNGFVIKIRSSP
jgi:hypothetical protein